RYHCQGLQTLSNLEIVAAADHRPEALKSLKQKTGGGNWNDYTEIAELFRNEQIDLASIATNTVSHLEVGQIAVEAGVPRLIVEKPIGNSVSRARGFAE